MLRSPFILLIVICFAALSLAACGSQQSNSSNENNPLIDGVFSGVTGNTFNEGSPTPIPTPTPTPNPESGVVREPPQIANAGYPLNLGINDASYTGQNFTPNGELVLENANEMGMHSSNPPLPTFTVSPYTGAHPFSVGLPQITDNTNNLTDLTIAVTCTFPYGRSDSCPIALSVDPSSHTFSFQFLGQNEALTTGTRFIFANLFTATAFEGEMKFHMTATTQAGSSSLDVAYLNIKLF